MNYLAPAKRNWPIKLVVALAFQLLFTVAYSQMRQMFIDNTDPDNSIRKISFYSATAGYVATDNWIGYTADSGRTFTPKYITTNNVNYGSYSVNLTLGFFIAGVTAFDQNTIITYGHYGLVPSILRSTDGGNTFTLVYHDQYNSIFSSGITDMVFLDNLVGFAVDDDRILRTNDGGLSWMVATVRPDNDFTNLEKGIDNSVVAFSTTKSSAVILKTTPALFWQELTPPDNGLQYIYFRTASTGWINVYNNSNRQLIYKTTDGGSSWTLQNDQAAAPFFTHKMRFTDDNTGYAIKDSFQIFKTRNGGKSWEALPRDNSFAHLGFSHYDIHFWNDNQFWAGGGSSFLELTTNSGGTPFPKAYFKIDTAGFVATGNVNLVNHSYNGYTYKWYYNDTLISTSYNANYAHYLYNTLDSIKLVVSNGTDSDSVVKYQSFHPPVIVSSFTPTTAGTGAIVTITGLNFTGATSVRFGSTPASAFTVTSPTTINATVGAGSSGDVRVYTPTGSGSRSGFTFLPPPTITSFSPTQAATGGTIIITGTNFVNVSAVKFAGVDATSFTVISPTEISAITPSSPSGAISVTTTGGTGTLTGFISLPVITSFTPVKGTHGTIMTINGTSLSGATSVTIGGVPAISFVVNSTNMITAVVGAGASGDVLVTKPGGSFSLGSFTWITPPVITSFSPASGPIGTTVNITGTGFDPVAVNNTVYFGAVKANITASSATSLTVEVPAGATFEPITATTNNLLAYSDRPFLVTFPNGGSISPTSFTNAHTINTGPSNSPFNLSSADLDGDGKADLLTTQQSSIAGNFGVYIYRNTSSSSTVSFENPISLTGIDYKAVSTGDFDGDGKLDVAVLNINSIKIFRNASTPGNIAFTENPALTTGNSLQGISINDVDGDGKTDIVVNQYPDGIVSVFKNTSEPGVITFANRINFPVFGAKNILLVNLDGDNKPEIVLPDGPNDYFYVLKNNSTIGSISFGAAISFPGYTYSYLSAGDVDGDNNIDIVSGDRDGSKVAIYRNTTSSGAISFAPVKEFNAQSSPAGIAVSDLDGDGKIDIATAPSNFNLSILKNTSTPGDISTIPKVDYTPGSHGGEHVLALVDINNDGKNDVVVVSQTAKTISFYLNGVVAEPFIQSFTPSLAGAGESVTISGGNFTGVTGVSFGGVPAASFVINSPTSITAVVGSGSSGNVTVTNTLGTGTLAGFIFGVQPPVITSVSTQVGPVNTTIIITGDNFNPVASDNTVYFGGVKGTVLSSTATTITVVPPMAGIFSSIKVTNHGLTASSDLSFTNTFSGAGPTINSNSFAPAFVNTGAGSQGYISDIDGDGKPDIVTSLGRVLRNTSITGNFAFEDNVYSTATGKTISDDLDGDGRQDIAFVAGNTLSVIKNLSNPGAITLSPTINFVTGIGSPTSRDIISGDIDGDGRPEIILPNYYSALTISIHKNNSSPGNIQLDPRSDISTDQSPAMVLLSDIDGDGKRDLLYSTPAARNFSVLLNTSVPGFISFDNAVHFGGQSARISSIDIDRDGKTDIACVHSSGLTIYRNTSTPGSVSFDPVTYSSLGLSSFVGANDFDGDGKVDLFVTGGGITLLFKNTSSPGTISLVNDGTGSGLGNNPQVFSSADMDGDGKPDLIGFNGGTISVHKNIIGGNGPTITAFSPTSASAGSIVTITGSGFTGTTSVNFGATPATSFTIVSSTIITAEVGSGTSGDLVITAPTGIASKSGFIYGSSPMITSITPSTVVGPGAVVAISGANFETVTAVTFGGTPAASFIVNSPTSITATLGNGNSGNVSVTTSNGTATFSGFTFYLAPEITSFTPSSGTPGTTITINGNNFIGTTSVNFGGAPASFTVISSTVINAVISSGTTGALTVTTPGGTATQNGFYFAVRPTITSFSPTSGQTGSSVLIRGTNFGAVTAVRFGGIDASSFTIVSPTMILANVGNGNTGTVTVVSASGNFQASGFTYLPGNAPVVTAITPSIASAGTTVTITGLNFTDATSVSFGGVAASSFTVISPTLIKAITASGSSGSVTVTTPNGTGSLAGFIFTTAPIITSINPSIGTPGSEMIIRGHKLGTDPSAIIVYFGNVKARVNAARDTLVAVTIPDGAIFSAISVTANGLTGYSGQCFLPTFAGSGSLDPSAFSTRTDSASTSGPIGLSLADIDVDGKPDITIINSGNATFYKNATTGTDIGFSPRVIQNNSWLPHKSWYADFNGDGKQDLVASNTADINAMYVYTNNSTPGTLLFSPGLLLNGSLGSFTATTADFDGDGKIDIACASSGGNVISLYKNTSTGLTISFAARINIATGSFPQALVPQDMNGDGKIDLVVTGGSPGFVQILRNTSTNGTISFGTSSMIEQGITGLCKDLAVADIEGDGNLDIVVVNQVADKVFVYRSKGIAGQLLFDDAIGLAVGDSPKNIVLSDIDGNGKPDLIVASSSSNNVAVLCNTSVTGTISFETRKELAVTCAPSFAATADMDADGRPEIILANAPANSISVLKNRHPYAHSENLVLCPNGNTTLISTLSGTTYKWQRNDGTGFVDIANDVNYAGVNTSALQLSGIPSSWYGYKYRCIVNGNIGAVFSLKFESRWTGAINNQWSNPLNWSCGVLPDGNTDVIIPNGNVLLDINGICRSLTIMIGTTFTVVDGNVLTVTH